jgi:LDH2 family malate/lactate/ureidoglycolate dehydrogenase
MTTKKRIIDAEKLTNFTIRALQKMGVPYEGARITADMLVLTDLRGVDSHGVARLASLYIKGLQEGRINPTPKPEISSQALATAVMDGDRGLGFVIGHQAMTEAIRRAETAGAGFVSVRNSTHFGASAVYAMMALEHDMIGISMTDATLAVAPPGSSKPGIGTNPLAVAVPTGNKPPFIFDMATSVVAIGKLEIARREGHSLPVGWVMDEDGLPITDPDKRVRGEGGLLPLGGTPTLRSYKGFGLAMVVEILCSVLAGEPATISRNSPEVRSPAGHFFGALNVASFSPLETFKKSMDEMLEATQNLPRLPGVEKVYVAGDYEAEIEKNRRANGIPLHPAVVSSLKDIAEELGVEYDL